MGHQARLTVWSSSWSPRPHHGVGHTVIPNRSVELHRAVRSLVWPPLTKRRTFRIHNFSHQVLISRPLKGKERSRLLCGSVLGISLMRWRVIQWAEAAGRKIILRLMIGSIRILASLTAYSRTESLIIIALHFSVRFVGRFKV